MSHSPHPNDHHEVPPPVAAWKDFVAGTCAGMAITIVGHPFDTIKVRLQTQDLIPPGARTSAAPAPARFTGALDCLFRTVRQESFFALYKGMSGPMLTVPVVNAIVFASYEFAKRELSPRDTAPLDPDTVPLGVVAAAGSFAGLTNAFVVGPVELVKSRMQVQYDTPGAAKLYRGSADCFWQVLRAKGPRGLLRGMSATLYREVPAYAMQFYAYEWLKRRLVAPGRHTKDLSPLRTMFAGGIAGVTCWACSYPQDVVKSRLQVQLDSGPSRYKPNKWLMDGGFVDCFKQTLKQEGYRGLWKGFGACVLRAFPANAGGFLTYEFVASYLEPISDN